MCFYKTNIQIISIKNPSLFKKDFLLLKLSFNAFYFPYAAYRECRLFLNAA